MEKNEMRNLFDLIKEVEICMLTTVDEEGHLRSRPMATQREYEGDALWFFTKNHGGKVAEIGEDSQVNLSYASPEEQKYVSVSGRASLSGDREKMRKLWNPAFRAWFPEGLDDPELGLMKVDIEKAETWESPGGMMVHLFGFTKAMLTGKTYQPGTHKKIDPSAHY